MIRVLFVCLGNICRSPLAESVFNQLVAEAGVSHRITCDSAGTSDYHIGEPPDKRTLAVGRQHKLQISHRGRQFSKQDFADFTYIIAMDDKNLTHIKAMLPTQDTHKKIFLMRDFEDHPAAEDVPDPYWSGPQGFEEVYGILLRTCRNLLAHIIREQAIG